MNLLLSRRDFLTGAAATGAAFIVGPTLVAAEHPSLAAVDVDFPLVDYHVHLDQVVTLEKALQISKERGVKFGIVEHAGTKENKYAGLLSSDEDLERYLAMLEGKPVYRGIQAEGLDWMTCFSKSAVAKLDYVLSDALTFPEKDGKRVELWRPWVQVEDKHDFMERYVDFNVQVIAREPIDILANPTFLPACIQKEHDTLWTPERMDKIIHVAAKYGVAIEINSNYRLPTLAFLQRAKKAGVKFSFGSNIHGLGVGMLGYCLEMTKELSLKRTEIFTPAAAGQKPIQRRDFS